MRRHNFIETKKQKRERIRTFIDSCVVPTPLSKVEIGNTILDKICIDFYYGCKCISKEDNKITTNRSFKIFIESGKIVPMLDDTPKVFSFNETEMVPVLVSYSNRKKMEENQPSEEVK